MSGYSEIVIGEHEITTSLRETVARISMRGEPTVLWVHESAQRAWKLPPSSSDLGAFLPMPNDAMSGPGWVRLSRDLHVALPAYSGDFAGLETPRDLVRALTIFNEHVGMQFMFSAPSTVLTLIGAKYKGGPVLPPAVPYVGSAFAIPAHTWTRPLEPADRRCRSVALFDRRGSYLAAWRSCELPDGEWHQHAGPLPIADADAQGYYLVDVRPLAPYVAAQRLHDPFARARGEELEGPIWITQPLAVLAAEISEEAQVPLVIEHMVTATRKPRALDEVATRLAAARVALDGIDDPAALAVLRAIKDGYTRGTAHLEFGRRPGHPLYRPAWRHTIVERSIANTWRALRKAVRRPIVVGGIDAAVFPVDPLEVPLVSGLREGQGLGAWRQRGRVLTMATAARRMRRKGRDAMTNGRELIVALMP